MGRRIQGRSLLGGTLGRERPPLLLLALAFLLPPRPAVGQGCDSALPGGTLTGIVNTYYPGQLTVGAGTAIPTQITVDGAAVRGAVATLAAGDMLIVMQMQDTQINDDNDSDYGDGAGGLAGSGYTALNNSGAYEYAVAQSGLFTGGTCPGGSSCIAIRGAGTGDGLLFTYTTAARVDTGSPRRGQRTFQVIRVPRYASGTLGAGLTAAAWDGRSGGVLAVDVAGALNLGGVTVSVDSLGFRGGVGESVGGQSGLSNTDYRRPNTNDAHARKGEGIACTPDNLSEVPGGSGTDGCPRGDRARGAPGNGGGGGTDGDTAANDENSGGGGGGNGGAGGLGGNSWSSNLAVGGRGGASVPAAAGRLVLGGGGGAGTSNNAGPGHGTAGGGIVMIRAGSVAAAGTVTARGPNAACSAQDAGGGGGAGGSILVFAEAGVLTGLTALGTGGRGGDANVGTCAVSGGAHGPGAGGGGGVIFASSAVAGGSSVAGGANGLTTGSIPYGATGGTGGPTITTNLVAAQIPGVQACTLATRASIAGLRVEPGLVEFATATQRRTAGFNVYATRDATGRGAKVRLNDRLVRAPRPDSATPILYRAEVRPSDEPYVLIEEIETSGRRRLLGPFARHEDDERLRRALGRIEGQSASGRLAIGGQEADTARRPIARGPARFPDRVRALKVEVPRAGPVVLALSELAAAGLPKELVQFPQSLRVWNFGRPVPFALVSQGGAPALAFQAEGLSTDYTGRNVYVVTGPVGVPLPTASLTRSGPPLPAGATRAGASVIYVPFIHPKADPWIWDYLVSDQEPAPLAFDLPGLGAKGEPAQVPVWLHLTGGSSHVHRVEAVLNGVPLGTARWTGSETAVLAGVVPRSALLESGNELQLRYWVSPESDVETGLAYVGALDVGLSLKPTLPVTPDRIAPYDPSRPDLAGVDYLIVTHADFMEPAHRLANLKRGQGLNPLVVDVERAYDRYASGAFEASAVQALLREYVKSGSAHYVLLLGDDTYDPRHFQGQDSQAWVPSLMAWDGEFGRVASENRYADVDGDRLPDLAIGRLPANTPAEATVLLDKIERVMGGAPLGPSHLVAVDDQDGAADVPFSQLAANVRDWLTGPITTADAGLGFAAARQTLLSGLAQDPPTLHYFGHGGPQTWADEGLLVPEDMAALAGTGGGTVLFAWTCEAQWYQYQDPSINESLLLVPAGGVAAAFGPAGISDPYLQKALSQRVYKGMAGGLALGDAIRAAKRDALYSNPGSEPVMDGWHLLGDPALVPGAASATSLKGGVRRSRFQGRLDTRPPMKQDDEGRGGRSMR